MTNVSEKTNRFIIVSYWISFVVAAFFALCIVPMNMDEAGIFHALACVDHPFAEYNIFREPCYVKNDLTTWGGFYLFRAQFYTGLFHTLLYTPFFYLFHAQYGQYVFGLTFFAAFAFLFSRQTPNPKLGLAIAVGFFPFVFQCVHDTGPVKFHLVMFPLMAFWIKKMIDEPAPLRYGYAVALAIFSYAAIEEKAFFVYLFPSALLYALAVSSEGQTFKSLKSKLMGSWAAWLSFGVTLAAGLTLLFTATNANGIPYLQWLMALSGNNNLAFGEWVSTYLSFQFFWAMYAHYHFDLAQSAAEGIVFKLVTLACMLGFTGVVWRYRKTVLPAPLQSIFLLLSYLSLVIMFAFMRNTWAGHHFIFMWVPLLLFFVGVLDRLPATPRLIFVGLFLGLNFASILVLTQNKLLVKVNDEKDVIFAYLNDEARAASSIYNFTTWGGYFIQALYGPKTQMAVYTEPYEAQPTVALYPAYADKLLEIAKFSGRQLYTVCYEPGLCSKEALETAFSGKATFTEVLPGLQHWHLFLATEAKINESRSR